MKNIETYFEEKQKAKADRIVFIGFVTMIVAATVTYLLK
jgi:hypothetical protein